MASGVVMRRIVGMRDQGMSYGAIARELTASGSSAQPVARCGSPAPFAASASRITADSRQPTADVA